MTLTTGLFSPRCLCCLRVLVQWSFGGARYALEVSLYVWDTVRVPCCVRVSCGVNGVLGTTLVYCAVWCHVSVLCCVCCQVSVQVCGVLLSHQEISKVPVAQPTKTSVLPFCFALAKTRQIQPPPPIAPALCRQLSVTVRP